MAKELVIVQWCDPCLEAGGHVEGQTFRLDVRMPGDEAGQAPAPFVVELCKEHAEPLAGAVLALIPFGRKPDEDSKPARRTTESRKGECPECGYGPVALGTLRKHAMAEHGKSLADVGFYGEAKATCDECGAGYPNNQGLAAHIRTAHAGKQPA